MAKQPFGVLILHGFRSSLDCVRGVDVALKAHGFPTRMPALRGHDASPEALYGVVWRDWVDDARAALRDLQTEAERIIIVGHSMGALVTLTLAADAAADSPIDSIVVAAPAIQLTSPFAPGHPRSFLAPLITLLYKRWDFGPATYADPALARLDTNYPWTPTAAIAEFFALIRATRRRLPEVRVPALILQSHADTAVDQHSAEIIYRAIATPPDAKRIVWFEKSEHEMFRDCEREAVIQTVVEYVISRSGARPTLELEVSVSQTC